MLIRLIPLFFLFSVRALAAACCGTGGSFPSLMTGDEWAQLSLTSSLSSVVEGPRSDIDQKQTLEFSGAILLSDQWQLGMSVPVIRQRRQFSTLDASAVGLGDIRWTGAYEILPEWEYSIWKPKGFVFAQFLFPAGGSIYQSVESLAVNVRGRGFYSLGLGTFLTKGWGDWDVAFQGELHRSFKRRFSEHLMVYPGWGGSFGFLGGWSPGGGAFRIGMKLGPSYEGPLQLRMGSTEVEMPASSALWSWEGSLQLSYLLSQAWSLSGIYTDQTWIGARSSETALNRGFALLLQRRWER